MGTTIAKVNIMEYDTVALDDANNAVVIIDQTLLPGRTELAALKTAQEIWEAIYLLRVRGAPAIGVAAAMGIYILAKQIDTEDFEVFYGKLCEYKEYLDSARPTAVNLSWALKRMAAAALKAGREERKPVSEVKEILRREALEIRDEDIRVCRKIGENGLLLVRNIDALQCGKACGGAIRYGNGAHLSGAGKGLSFSCVCGRNTAPFTGSETDGL